MTYSQYILHKTNVEAERRAFLDKYEDKDGILRNPPYESPVPSQTAVETRLQYAISGDPRTRKMTDSSDQVFARRKEATLEDMKKQMEANRMAAEKDMNKTAHHLEAMGLRGHQPNRLPHWAEEVAEQ